MPFSHIEIEREKNRAIGLLFSILVMFYLFPIFVLGSIYKLTIFVKEGFLSYAYWPDYSVFYPLPYLTPAEMAVVSVIALAAGILHWHISLKDAAEKMLKSLNAQPLDLKDAYHQRLRNIVEEVRVATGGEEVRCVVIPSISMNAFAIMDFKKRPVIGVTEGLLSKLKRRQLEAVVGHEMAHIVSGDCLMTTISCALFGLYSDILRGIEAVFGKAGEGERGASNSYYIIAARTRVAISLFIIYIVLYITQAMASVMKIAISRQREYRADAIAVRLTRDPLALAEALYTISRNYRRVGTGGSEGLAPIFILSPRESVIIEEEGVWADLFSTHPPVRKRLNVLLSMARSNLETLKEEMETKEKMKPRKDAVTQLTSAPPLKESWFVNDENGQWIGPFSLLELSQIEWFKPDSWIRQEGGDRVTLAYENKRLRDMFKGNLKEEKISEFLCPHCRIELVQILYEGAPIWRCNYCEGVRVEEPKVIRILSRRDHGFSEEITRLARFYDPALRKREGVRTADQVGAKFFLNCPSCQREMRRKFYSLAYPVEIDYCDYCNYIWFGKNKLEILQYLGEQSS